MSVSVTSPALTVPLTMLFGFVAMAGSACQTDDTGHCCQTVISDASSALPVPEFPGDGGIPRNLVSQHPAFDCASLTCVSWQGSDPFCTRKCSPTRPCPLGYDCEPVLESSPGAGANIQPDDKFCVRRTCTSDQDCPEELRCTLIQSSQSDSTARHCTRPENKCER
jgi:hypothetical protein